MIPFRHLEIESYRRFPDADEVLIFQPLQNLLLETPPQAPQGSL